MSDSVETVVEGGVRFSRDSSRGESDSVETVKWGIRFSRDSEMGCQIQ